MLTVVYWWLRVRLGGTPALICFLFLIPLVIHRLLYLLSSPNVPYLYTENVMLNTVICLVWVIAGWNMGRFLWVLWDTYIESRRTRYVVGLLTFAQKRLLIRMHRDQNPNWTRKHRFRPVARYIWKTAELRFAYGGVPVSEIFKQLTVRC